ncbi:MAG: hypothetical protein ACI9UO_001735 [Nitrospinales bacterium]|jgi:hypothetical protein
MGQSDLNSLAHVSERKYLYCDSCNSLLPAPGYYCVQCEPPQGPELESEGELKFSQAMLRISLLTLLFLLIAVFKLDIKLMHIFSSSAQETPMKIAEDEDFKIFFKVNTGLVNLRSLPNMKTSKILGSLVMGAQVEVLGAERGWSKVKLKVQTGEEPNMGWIATKLLDSEIK